MKGALSTGPTPSSFIYSNVTFGFEGRYFHSFMAVKGVPITYWGACDSLCLPIGPNGLEHFFNKVFLVVRSKGSVVFSLTFKFYSIFVLLKETIYLCQNMLKLLYNGCKLIYHLFH